MEALAWIEQTPLSLFVREDFYAYFVLLIGHAWGMALLVGGGLAVAARVLGVASGTRLDRWAGVFTVMKVGAVLAAVSGLGLLAGYPAKALTNPIFAVKFACLIGAVWLGLRAFRLAAAGASVPGRAKVLAAAAIALWIGGVAGGKLLLYTNSVLLTSDLAA